MVKRKIGIKAKHDKFENKSLLDMTTSYLIANWYKFTHEEKLRIALPVALKGISDKHEHSGALTVKMESIKLGGKAIGFDVGST